MRRMLIVGAVVFGLWYAFVGGRSIKETHVYDLYNEYWNAFAAGDSKTVCSLFDSEFSAVVRTRTPAGQVEEAAGKSQACEGTDKFFAMKKAMEEKAGEELFINTEYTVDEIAISPDEKTATVRVSSEVRIGTEKRLFLKIRESQTDKIVRSLGKARFIATDGDISFGN